MSGLWYDEITIYSIASQHSITDMLNVDKHRFLLFPLYYIIYHLWLIIFGNTDFIIRLMSVFFDILGIVSAYFVGKELVADKNKRGNIYMILFTVNSLLIYYAQEAKFYSITTFFVNLALFFGIKYIKQTSGKNFLIFYLINLLLILTYTSQVLLTFITYVAILIYSLFAKNKIPIKHLLIFPTVFFPIIILTLLIPNYFSGNFDAVVIDGSFVLLVLQNFFSPVLNSIQNNELNYNLIIIKNLLNFYFFMFVVFPVLYLLLSIIISLKKSVIARYMMGIAFSYIAFHIIISFTTNYSPLVRYLIPVLPLVLASCSIGINELKNKAFFAIFLLINCVGLLLPFSAVKIERPDGYKQLAAILVNNKISPDANFILPIRTNLLDKYFYINGERYSLYTLNSVDFQATYLTDSEINEIKQSSHPYNAYYRYLTDDKISIKMINAVLNHFNQSNMLILIEDKTICSYSNNQVKQIANSQYYTQVPLQFLRLSKLNNDLVHILSQNMTLEKFVENNKFNIWVFIPNT